MLNMAKTCSYEVKKMMSHADLSAVGCLLSWEISKITERAIASIKSFLNLHAVTSSHKMLRHVTHTFHWLRSYQVRFFKMSSFHYKDALL